MKMNQVQIKFLFHSLANKKELKQTTVFLILFLRNLFNARQDNAFFNG